MPIARTTALLAAALCAAAGCNSLTSENEGELTLYLENAAHYYDAGHYQRAYHQWEQALELDDSNDKARLGQAMALYRLGCANTKEAVPLLADAAQRLDALRREHLGDIPQWRAELGYALTQERWADLYDRKLRKLEEDARRGLDPDPQTVKSTRLRFESHLAAAHDSFQHVLAGEEKEPRDKLTCWLGLARVAAWRGDLEETLTYARKYQEQVINSKNLWRSGAKASPREAIAYEAKLAGAELQEAELLDLMANCSFKLGRLDEAEKHLDQVIAMFPERATAYLNRGRVREQRGDLDLARGDYKKFLVLTDLPEGDTSIIEAARRLSDVEARLAEADTR